MIVVEEFGDPVDEGLPAVGGTEDEGGDVAGLNVERRQLTGVNRLDAVAGVAGGWEEEPGDGAIEAAGERKDLGGVDVATPFAVVGLLDRRDAGLVEAVTEERLEPSDRSRLGSSRLRGERG